MIDPKQLNDLSNEERDAVFDKLITSLTHSGKRLGKKSALAKESVYLNTPLSKDEATIQLLKDFKSERAELPPAPQLESISSPKLRKKASQFNIFFLDIPLSLVPKDGYAFNQIECQIEFGTNLEAKDKPQAHSLFPGQQNKTLAGVDMRFALGVDEELKLGPIEASREGMGLVKGEVTGQGKLVLRLEHQAYEIRRATIVAQGEGHPEVYWKLWEQQFSSTDPVRLSLILLVPKQVTQPIYATATLLAYRDFQFWSSTLAEVWDFATRAIKEKFESGLPLTHQVHWQLDIPSQTKRKAADRVVPVKVEPS